ncbi:hypothetical protein GGR58DRAFT_248429 [Xylaria digitata]|nr:hypothetical protein GGR58DRAFT_248429 [Xylaria digitata]
MSTLSGRRSYPRRSYIDNSIDRRRPLHHSFYTQNCNCLTPISDKQGRFRRKSTSDLKPKVPQGPRAVHTPSACSSPSIYYRRTPTTAVSPRRSRCGITKRQERPRKQSIPSRPQISVKEDTSTQADASAVTLSESASGSSFQVSVGKYNHVCQTKEAPSSERILKNSGGGNTPVVHEDDRKLTSSSLFRPKTEYEANLLAASEETRDLYLEYYNRTHSGSGTEAEDYSEAYWKWDSERQKWFHTDADTQSVVWFLG